MSSVSTSHCPNQRSALCTSAHPFAFMSKSFVDSPSLNAPSGKSVHPSLARVNSQPALAAFAFVSKSLEDVQRNAESDLKLMSERAENLKQMALNLDGTLAKNLDDWENITFVGPGGKDVSAGNIIRTIKDGSARARARARELTSPEAFKDMAKDLEVPNFFRDNMKGPGLGFRRVHSDSNLTHGILPPPWPVLHDNPLKGPSFIRVHDWETARGVGPSNATWQPMGEDWELLKKVKEGLKELEISTAATRVEFLQKMQKNLKLNVAVDQTRLDPSQVPPLDVPELLETLIRQSEPLLETLGINKDVPNRVCQMLRNCKKRLTPPSSPLRQSGVATSSSPFSPPPSWEEVGAHPPLETDDLDARIATVQNSTGYRYSGGLFGTGRGSGSGSGAGAGVDTGMSSRQGGRGVGGRRNIAIFTTASLPWMTGTAVNPLLRAAYLGASGEHAVTLVLPWLSVSDQRLVYPNNLSFETPGEQEEYVREWVKNRIGFASEFKIAFYPGKFSLEKRSILGVGDISSAVPPGCADVAILEEPEHLTWYYHGARWTDRFSSVVGVVHTNYIDYVRRETWGEWKARGMEVLNNWMVRCYCDKVIRLSAATQSFPRSVVCNVHGVGSKFIEIGKKMADLQSKHLAPPPTTLTPSPSPGTGEAVLEASGTVRSPWTKGAYYLGKMVWGKGYRELLDLVGEHREELGGGEMDVFGSGEDSEAVQAAAVGKGLKMRFHKGRDHADQSLQQFKVFINPSLSDVVCTTTAEALAMGKFVVCADHPSNEFFKNFPNCYTYKTPQEFVTRVKEALASEPQPLTQQQQHLLSWEAATERFLETSGLAPPPTPPPTRPSLAAASHNPSTKPQSVPATMINRTFQNARAEKGPHNPTPPPANHGTGDPTMLTQADDVAMNGASIGGGSAPLNMFSLSLTSPHLEGLTDTTLFAVHYLLSGIELCRTIVGAPEDSMHCGEQLSKELGLLPPHVQRPVYGW